MLVDAAPGSQKAAAGNTVVRRIAGARVGTSLTCKKPAVSRPRFDRAHSVSICADNVNPTCAALQ
jgi:hypothetical protein